MLYLEAAEDTLRRRGKGLSVFLGGTENRKTHEMVTHADLVGLVLAHGHLHGAGVAAAPQTCFGMYSESLFNNSLGNHTAGMRA